jgi:hypothetical protein
MNLHQISFTQSLLVPTGNKTIFWFIVYSCYPSWDDPGSGPPHFQQNPPKTINSPGKPEGNTTHRMHCAVSPEIVLMGGCNAQVLAAWEMSGDM